MVVAFGGSCILAVGGRISPSVFLLRRARVFILFLVSLSWLVDHIFFVDVRHVLYSTFHGDINMTCNETTNRFITVLDEGKYLIIKSNDCGDCKASIIASLTIPLSEYCEVPETSTVMIAIPS